MTLMSWQTPACESITLHYEDFLHIFRVVSNGREAEVWPADRKDALNCALRLNAGECPVADAWEDGYGQLVADLLAAEGDE